MITHRVSVACVPEDRTRWSRAARASLRIASARSPPGALAAKPGARADPLPSPGRDLAVALTLTSRQKETLRELRPDSA